MERSLEGALLILLRPVKTYRISGSWVGQVQAMIGNLSLHLGPYTSTWKQRKLHLSLAFPTGELQEQVELITPRIAAKLGEATSTKGGGFHVFLVQNGRNFAEDYQINCSICKECIFV